MCFTLVIIYSQLEKARNVITLILKSNMTPKVPSVDKKNNWKSVGVTGTRIVNS